MSHDSTHKTETTGADPSASVGRGRPGVAAGRVLVTILVCLLMWTLLYAPRMNDAARTHPLGVRRTAALIALAPFATLSDAVGLSVVTDGLERLVGLDPDAPPGGTIDLPPDPLPPVISPPPPPPDRPDPSKDTAEPIRTPTAVKRLRVVIVGDSFAAGLGYHAGRVFEPDLVRILRQGRISTGLARPDYFDWPAAMRQIVDGFRPDLVIVMIGENDRQNMQTKGGKIDVPIGTFDWSRAYQERVEAFMSIATSGGARVSWVGLPSLRDRERNVFSGRANAIYTAAAEEVGDVAFFDTPGLFDGRGGYTPFYRDDGKLVEARANDGLHFTPAGYAILVREIAAAASSEFGLDVRAYRG